VIHVSKPRRDAVREDRIHEEAIADAYGPEEQAMGWYYYLESKIHFPFSTKCIAAHPLSPLRKGETVSARRLAPEQLCAHDMLVRAAWQGRNFAIPLSQLMPAATDPSTHEAIADWHYWVARGYLL
jgi:Calcium binding